MGIWIDQYLSQVELVDGYWLSPTDSQLTKPTADRFEIYQFFVVYTLVS